MAPPKTQDSDITIAVQALSEPNFTKFFIYFDKITDESYQKNLIDQAVKIAISQKNISTLQILAQKAAVAYSDTGYYYFNPLHTVIETLVEFNTHEADAAAISIAALYNQETDKSKTLWQVLCNAFWDAGKYENVKKLYQYLKDSHEKLNIVENIIGNINIANAEQEWFKWFIQYLKLPQSFDSRYYKQESPCKSAISFLVKHPDFNSTLNLFIININTESYRNFTSELFFALLSERQFQNTETLLKKISKDFPKLGRIYEALDDEKHYEILEEEDFLWLESDKIVVILAERFFNRNQEKDKNSIVCQLLECLKKSPIIQDNFQKEFFKICCRNNRADVVVHFLKNTQTIDMLLFKCFARIAVSAILPDNDYEFILQKLNDWPDITVLNQLDTLAAAKKLYHFEYEDGVTETTIILQKIPRALVIAEDMRRKDIEHNKKLAQEQRITKIEDNKISRYDDDYNKLTQEIDYLIQKNILKKALTLTKKIVKSKYRDVYLKQLALLFMENNEQQEAQEACNLLAHESERWKLFPLKFSSNKYQKTLTWLLEEDDFDNIKDIVLRYIQRIFTHNTPNYALDIIFNINLLNEKKVNLNKYNLTYKPCEYTAEISDEEDDDSDIVSVTSIDKINNQSLEDLITNRFVRHYAESKNLIKKLSELRSQGIVGFEVVTLDYHLRNQKWTTAIAIINLFASENRVENYHLHYNEHLTPLEKIVLKYFKAKTLSKQVLSQAKQIKSQDLYARVLMVLLDGKILNDEIVRAACALQSIHHQYELLNKIIEDKLKQSSKKQDFIYISNLIMNNVKDEQSRKFFFINHILTMIFYKSISPDTKEETYWRAELPFWYEITQKTDALSLLQYMLDSSCEWENLIYSVVGETIGSIFKQIDKTIASNPSALLLGTKIIYNKLIQIESNSLFKDFIERLYLSSIRKIANLEKISDEFGLDLLTHFESITKINSYEMTAALLMLVKNCAKSTNDEYITRVITSTSDRFKNYFSTEYISIVNNLLIELIRNNKVELCYKIAFIFIPKTYLSFANPHQDRGFLFQLPHLCTSEASMHRSIAFMNDLQSELKNNNIYGHSSFNDLKIKFIIVITEKLANTESRAQVYLLYNTYLKKAQLPFLKNLLDILLKKDITLAKKIIEENPGMPEDKLAYRKSLVQNHFAQLNKWIGSEYANKINEFYITLANILQNKSDLSTQNNLLTNMKNLLDKSFSAYYSKVTQGGIPPKLFGKIFNLPAPVPEHAKGKTPNDKLDSFLKDFGFTSIEPEIYQFILLIQPASNTNYKWLSQLRTLRNNETHDKSYLSSTPTVNGDTIDMMTFLPEALIGIEKILIKLFNPKISNDKLEQSSLGCLLPFNTQEINIAAYALGVEQNHQQQASRVLSLHL